MNKLSTILRTLNKTLVPDTRFVRQIKSHILRLMIDNKTRSLDGNFILEHNKRYVPPICLLEITNICNSNCIFCGYQFQKRAKGVIEDSVYKTTINNFVKLGTTHLDLTPLVGEAFVDSKILEKISYARQVGYEKISLATNGILLNKHGFDDILQSGITEMGISVSALDNDEYKKLYRNDNYERVLNNISILLRKKREQNRPIKIHLAFRSAMPEKAIFKTKDYIKYIMPYVDHTIGISVLKYVDNRGGLITSNHIKGLWVQRQVPKVKNVPCYRTYMPYILYNGDVLACSCVWVDGSSEQLIIGNILEQSVDDILFGDRLYTIRKSFVSGNLPAVCVKCSFYSPELLNNQ